MIRDLLLLAAGFFLVVFASSLGTVLHLGLLMPNVILPIVIYLGMAPDVSLARGAMLSFALGWLLDSACGNAMGLYTFIHVATFLVARGAGFRLIMRGRISQVMITSLAAIVGAVTLIALRSIFRPPQQFEAISIRHLFAAVLAPALSTGAIAPFVFQLVRRIDAFRRREEGAAVT
jgi:rod shape-determining protein MreD